jgi:4-hydroxy-tetrahydrodipicolinate reductase
VATRIVLAGATGWVGRALVPAIAQADDLALVGAVARTAAGSDIGEAVGMERLGVKVSATLAEALAAPCDVVIDYTKPDAVKHHVMQALAHSCHVVIGTSGLSAEDYARIDTAAHTQHRGVLAAGNFSITATLLKLFALEAARHVPDVEIIDYASPAKPDTPSGTARELAELLGQSRRPASSKPVAELTGVRETRGGAIGAPTPVQVHSLRLPSFVLSCEAVFGADNERLVIRHDAGPSPGPYVAGTLLAARSVGTFVGLRRGLEAVMGMARE